MDELPFKYVRYTMINLTLHIEFTLILITSFLVANIVHRWKYLLNYIKQFSVCVCILYAHETVSVYTSMLLELVDQTGIGWFRPVCGFSGWKYLFRLVLISFDPNWLVQDLN